MSLLAMSRNPAALIIPGYRKLPTRLNRYIDQCKAKMDALLLEVMNGQQEAVRRGLASSYSNDLLGRMLSAASEGWDTNTNVFNFACVFNNCKLFYLAGQDTVANATTYAALMLAKHPKWQDRARKEVMEVLGNGDICNSNTVSRLKVVHVLAPSWLRLDQFRCKSST